MRPLPIHSLVIASFLSGLTTAASLWATAALGIAVGLQHYVLAIGATLLMLVVLRGLERFERGERED